MELERLERLNKLKEDIDSQRIVVEKIILYIEEITIHPSYFAVQIISFERKISRTGMGSSLELPLNDLIIKSLEERLITEETKLKKMIDEFRKG